MAYVYVTIVTEENTERWGDARDLKWHLLTPRFGTQCNAAVLVTVRKIVGNMRAVLLLLLFKQDLFILHHSTFNTHLLTGISKLIHKLARHICPLQDAITAKSAISL